MNLFDMKNQSTVLLHNNYNFAEIHFVSTWASENIFITEKSTYSIQYRMLLC